MRRFRRQKEKPNSEKTVPPKKELFKHPNFKNLSRNKQLKSGRNQKHWKRIWKSPIVSPKIGKMFSHPLDGLAICTWSPRAQDLQPKCDLTTKMWRIFGTVKIMLKPKLLVMLVNFWGIVKMSNVWFDRPTWDILGYLFEAVGRFQWKFGEKTWCWKTDHSWKNTVWLALYLPPVILHFFVMR